MQGQSAVIPIPLGFVTAFLVRGERPILVDTGIPGSSVRILEKLSANGVAPREISLILITHSHSDHSGSAADLQEQTGAPVAIHQLDSECLRRGLSPQLHPTGIMGRLLMLMEAKAQPLDPDIIVEGEMSLEEFGVDGKIIPTPGHTPGSISVALAGGEVIVGDLMMGGIIRRGRPDYPPLADDIGQIEESIKSIMRLSPRRIFVAHGGPFDPEAVRRRFATG
jgi:hydroxyacylglutathione hydrolase